MYVFCYDLCALICVTNTLQWTRAGQAVQNQTALERYFIDPIWEIAWLQQVCKTQCRTEDQHEYKTDRGSILCQVTLREH